MNQIIKNVSEVKEGQEIGFSWTANNDAYKTIGKVIKINGNTIRIQSQLHVRGYEKDQIFTYSFRKITKQNHVFDNPNIEEINNFNQKNKEVRDKVEQVINQYWKKKIEKAEQEQKEQGVYVESETFLIDFGKGELVPQYKKYGISV